MEEERFDLNENKKAREKKLIGILRSGNRNAIIDSLNELRVNGSIDVLPEVLEVMLSSKEESVIKACSNLLNDLKLQDAVEILISAIKDKRFLPIRNILVASCWQNGLIYHEEYELFADILIKDEFIIAIEAFTVLENSLGDLDDSQILKLIKYLQTALPQLEEEKRSLVEEMLLIVKSY